MSQACCYVDILVITAMVVAAVVVFLVPTTFILLLVTAVTMLFLVTRYILAVVPVVLHKQDPLAAGIVFTAVLAPMFGVARRYAQINRWAVHRYPFNRYRLTINHLRLRIIAYVESAIETGLANTDRNSNVGSECRGGDSGSSYRCCEQKTFHVKSPVVSGFQPKSLLKELLRKVLLTVNQSQQNDYDSNHQQNVDETTHSVRSNQPQQPQDKHNNGNGIKHDINLSILWPMQPPHLLMLAQLLRR